jgi:hypothetical protein
MAAKSRPHAAVFRQLGQLVEPGDVIVARFWGLTGWSMDLWMAASELFAILLVLPFILALPHLYVADIALCGTAGLLLSASYWTRPALVIAVTGRRQLLCCRISRPLRRTTITQAPLDAAQLADFRRGWIFGRLRYRGPGTDGKTVRLNVPAACRQGARAATEVSEGLAIAASESNDT